MVQTTELFSHPSRCFCASSRKRERTNAVKFGQQSEVDFRARQKISPQPHWLSVSNRPLFSSIPFWRSFKVHHFFCIFSKFLMSRKVEISALNRLQKVLSFSCPNPLFCWTLLFRIWHSGQWITLPLFHLNLSHLLYSSVPD